MEITDKNIIKNFAWGKICGTKNKKICRLLDCRNEKFLTDACIVGEAYGFDEVPDGTLISTMPLRTFATEGEVKTFGNKSYFLDGMNSEYKAFLDAIDSEIPIMTKINIYGNSSGIYQIVGQINEKGVAGFLISHDFERNLLNIKINCGGVITVFPDWESNVFEKSIFGTICGSDIKIKNLKIFCNADKVRIIFPK